MGYVFALFIDQQKNMLIAQLLRLKGSILPNLMLGHFPNIHLTWKHLIFTSVKSLKRVNGMQSSKNMKHHPKSVQI